MKNGNFMFSLPQFLGTLQIVKFASTAKAFLARKRKLKITKFSTGKKIDVRLNNWIWFIWGSWYFDRERDSEEDKRLLRILLCIMYEKDEVHINFDKFIYLLFHVKGSFHIKLYFYDILIIIIFSLYFWLWNIQEELSKWSASYLRLLNLRQFA